MREPVFAIQRLLRRLQIINRFFEEDFYTGLPALQSLLLIEIDSTPSITATELCEVFALEKSIISRAISSLEKKKLIKRKQTSSDARRQIFEITKAGEKILVLNDTQSNEFVKNQLESFSAAEINKFTKFFEKFCDGLSLKDSKKRKNDTDIRVAIRRYTKGIKLVHATYLTSGLTPSQWFSLEEIYWSQNQTCTASFISKKLRFIPSSVNQILSVLEKGKLIERKISDKNKREVLISITSKGAKLFEQVESDTYSLFSKSLNVLSEDEMFEFASLLRRYIKEIEPGEVWLDRETVVNEINTEEERRRSRGFIATQYVNNKKAESLPETIIGSNNSSFSLEIKGSLKSVIELDRENLAVLNLSSAGEVNKDKLNQFIEIANIKTKKQSLTFN